MKIAITADVHLLDRASNPERYNALEYILETVQAGDIKVLIIAGDLFDKDIQNYSDFEKVCQKFPGVKLHIIPGNHDVDISSKSITSSNVVIYTEPTLVEFGSSTFLFVPYKENVTMYEYIVGYLEGLKGKEWVLVGHGDYYEGLKVINPLEKGTYMPISRGNIQSLRPKAVFLGHIHKPVEWHKVAYCGSPCGIDINECGKRRFLVYDTQNGSTIAMPVKTDFLFYNETFVIVPSEDEVEHLQKQIEERIQSWELDPADKAKAVVRVSAQGYAMDRSGILDKLEKGFGEFSYYKDEKPNIEELEVSNDPQLADIAMRTMRLIEESTWDLVDGEPDKAKVKIEALKTIYGS
jgi:DNA repair exonuclease SbcCD nuclease subunit